jgi:Na+/citrate or Na+/malate symporter
MEVKETARKIVNFELRGLPIFAYLLMGSLTLVFWRMGKLAEGGIIGAFAFMWTIGIFFFAIGEKLPIWKDYVGGGWIMAFIGTAVMKHFGIISGEDAKFLTNSVVENRFLYFLLVGVIGGSILSVNRKVLIKSVLGFLPLMLLCIAGAMIFGLLGGLLFGIAPGKIITMYVLPILGGGNAAGAIPMSEVYASVTGKAGGIYYSFAISILTLANIIAILMASALHRIGEKFPKLTGNGRLMHESVEIKIEDKEDKGTDPVKLNTHGATYFAVGMLLLAFLLYALIPAIHLFAWAVILFLILNILDIISDEMKASLQAISAWGMKIFLIPVLVTFGSTTDLNEFINAFSLTNIIIATLIVLGAALGTGLSARIFKFYPIDASIAVGLCMANRGGSGDIEVLSASRRMELFPYSQIANRIGGGIALILAGYLFRVLL